MGMVTNGECHDIFRFAPAVKRCSGSGARPTMGCDAIPIMAFPEEGFAKHN